MVMRVPFSSGKGGGLLVSVMRIRVGRMARRIRIISAHPLGRLAMRGCIGEEEEELAHRAGPKDMNSATTTCIEIYI